MRAPGLSAAPALPGGLYRLRCRVYSVAMSGSMPRAFIGPAKNHPDGLHTNPIAEGKLSNFEVCGVCFEQNQRGAFILSSSSFSVSRFSFSSTLFLKRNERNTSF